MSNKSNNKSQNGMKWLKAAPLAAVVLSIIFVSLWARWYLYRSASGFQQEFIRQNISELAAGDTLALSRRLESLSNVIPATCVVGKRSDHTFYERIVGTCGTGLLHQEVLISVPGNRDTTVLITMGLQPELLGVAIVLILVQILLLALLAKSTQLAERAQLMVAIEKERAASATHKAIANMTQMLAHDVRKPFSMLRMALNLLGNAKDPESVKKVMSRVVPEIDRAMSSVDGMISDVMEVGSVSTSLIREPAGPESLIESTLGEICRIYPQAQISFSYDLKHTHMVSVHVQKMGRVFSNIVGNAFQAMRYKGQMWFRTSESDGMITFCIGNAGSVILPESLPKLFEAFFTSGKKGGTGLGLAIAEKIVTAHGGKIWCESSKTVEHPEGKVEFFFTMPIAADLMNIHTAALSGHSSDIAKRLVVLNENTPSSPSTDEGALSLEEEIVRAHNKTGRALRVLIIDDEAIYRSGLASHLMRTPELVKALELKQADGSAEAMQAVTDQDYDLIITDVDMGKMSLNGFELVRELRKHGSKALICVHSNRIVAADNKAAIEAGANSFIPKPMAHAQLLRLILQASSGTSLEAFVNQRV